MGKNDYLTAEPKNVKLHHTKIGKIWQWKNHWEGSSKTDIVVGSRPITIKAKNKHKAKKSLLAAIQKAIRTRKISPMYKDKIHEGAIGDFVKKHIVNYSAIAKEAPKHWQAVKDNAERKGRASRAKFAKREHRIMGEEEFQAGIKNFIKEVRNGTVNEEHAFHVVRQSYSLEPGQVGGDVKEKIVSKHHSIKQAGRKLGSMISGKMVKGPDGTMEHRRGIRAIVRDVTNGREYSRNDVKKFVAESINEAKKKAVSWNPPEVQAKAAKFKKEQKQFDSAKREIKREKAKEKGRSFGSRPSAWTDDNSARRYSQPSRPQYEETHRLPDRPGHRFAYDTHDGDTVYVSKKPNGSFYLMANKYDKEANATAMREHLTKLKAKYAGVERDEEYHVMINDQDEVYITEATNMTLNEIMGRRGEFIMTKYRMYQHPDHVEVWKRGMDLKGFERDSSHPNAEVARKYVKKATADEIKSYQKITGRKLKWTPGKINAME